MAKRLAAEQKAAPVKSAMKKRHGDRRLELLTVRWSPKLTCVRRIPARARSRRTRVKVSQSASPTRDGRSNGVSVAARRKNKSPQATRGVTCKRAGREAGRRASGAAPKTGGPVVARLGSPLRLRQKADTKRAKDGGRRGLRGASSRRPAVVRERSSS